jgi:hypothetical protein
MVRLALANAGQLGAAIVRVAPRLKGGAIAAVVDADGDVAKDLSRQLGAAITATATDRLHEQYEDAFDAWVAATPAGLLITPHGRRPLELRPERWDDNPAGWLWGHEHRFLSSVRTVQESVASGKLGDVGLVRIHQWQAQRSGDARAALSAQLDVACWLIGQAPTVLFAQSRAGAPRDYVQVHLGFADDRMAVIDSAASLPDGDDYYTLSVIGATGASYADDHHNQQLLFGGGRPQAIRTSQGDAALLGALQEFIDATAKSRPPSCGAAEWQRAQRLSAAVESSLSSGQSVPLGGNA